MRIPVLLVFSAVLLGLVGYAYSQSVVTTTTTRVVTVPPTTIVTEVTVEGATRLLTVELSGFLLVLERYEPDRVCTVHFTTQQYPSVITIPGTTIYGTTLSTVISQRTIATTVISVEGGTTATTTGLENVEVDVNGIRLLLPVYGVGREFCERVTITNIASFIVEQAPATIMVAYEGFTMAGTTVSFEFPNFGVEVPPMFTLTKTKTGMTTTLDAYFPGTFYTTLQVVQPTTYRQTVTRPGTTYVEAYTTVITLTEAPTRTTPRATTTVQTTPAQTTAVPTPTQTTAPPPSGLPPDLLVPVIALAIIIVVAVVALRFRH